ncbi:hypothetical protein CPARA_3gp464 (nucleomorph) [Cryptomonas paramecium]|uniref:Uncharacterized protein n=1 Tax=Cryptomonas paramaecium TaxID=2898 RepID=F2HI59_9CRYP|nr:hypothetical protein CPARA_3gp464 [Cryptomonas paramecium]AEA39122.1 hypothetical protein CPARA_3gp464 [Cryptomonas paramecium]|mmetsp:Transcript_58655/g.155109  ORF Transcript_58655/g.155109 Transcript_58655/m.155109 type:complete len:305 (-) Transcript_58655:1648-2562(-)
MLLKCFYIKKLTSFLVKANFLGSIDSCSSLFFFFVEKKKSFANVCKYYKKLFNYTIEITIVKKNLNVKKNLQSKQIGKHLYFLLVRHLYFFSKIKLLIFFNNIKLLYGYFSRQFDFLLLFCVLSENFFCDSSRTVQMVNLKDFYLFFVLNFLNKFPAIQLYSVEKKTKNIIFLLIYSNVKNKKLFTFTKQKKFYLKNIFKLKKIIKRNRLARKKYSTSFSSQTIFQVFFHNFFHNFLDFSIIIVLEKIFNFSKIFNFFPFKIECKCCNWFGCIYRNTKLYYSRSLCNFHFKTLVKKSNYLYQTR